MASKRKPQPDALHLAPFVALRLTEDIVQEAAGSFSGMVSGSLVQTHLWFKVCQKKIHACGYKGFKGLGWRNRHTSNKFQHALCEVRSTETDDLDVIDRTKNITRIVVYSRGCLQQKPARSRERSGKLSRAQRSQTRTTQTQAPKPES